VSVVRIFSALKDRLDALTPPITTVYPGMTHEPVTGSPYQKAFLLPAQSRNAGLGIQAATYETGLFQVSAFYGADEDVAAMERAEVIRDHFARGTPGITFDGLTVRIPVKPSIGPLLVDDGWISVAVSVRYFAHVFPG